MERELEQLTKTYKAGIINDSEFKKGKERIQEKMDFVKDDVEKKEEGKKIVKEILGAEAKPEIVIEKPKADKPKVEKLKVVKPKVEKVKKLKPRKEAVEDDYEGSSTFSKVIIFAGIVAILLLLILVRVFTDEPAVTEKDLTGIEGEVVMDVYLDFSCKYAPETWENMLELKKIYGDHITVRVRHFPVTPDGIDVSNAIQCARDQQTHMKYIARVFDNMDELDINSLKNYGWVEGLDVVEFHDCLDERKNFERVKDDFSEGVDRGVVSSPTYFVGDEMLVGTQVVTTLEKAVDEQLLVE